MKKMVISIVAVVVVVIVAAGAAMWFWMQKPLYEPGMVRAGKNLRAALEIGRAHV